MAVHIHGMDNPLSMGAQLCLVVHQAWVALRTVKLRFLAWNMLWGMLAVLTSCGGHIHHQPTFYDAIGPFYWRNLKQSMSTLLLQIHVSFTATCYCGTPWHHCTFPESGRILLPLALLLQSYWLLVLKCIPFIPIHDRKVLLVSDHHLMTSNVIQKLKSLSKEEKYSNVLAGSVENNHCSGLHSCKVTYPWCVNLCSHIA